LTYLAACVPLATAGRNLILRVFTTFSAFAFESPNRLSVLSESSRSPVLLHLT
jgi:hypothetical protein